VYNWESRDVISHAIAGKALGACSIQLCDLKYRFAKVDIKTEALDNNQIEITI
jgi:hypothetical protein